ncbi:Endonuclease, Uma2 family [Nostoc flagelliforme CCNUN1]|uniref:Endonuclease, Uma2 family n=1 Tax=Nostoc flagelliforme CCNUN1 TaxID=2038116 RepID=A0A2K8SNX1_9NOSO|nr:Endonuclease, Uma2 family [Nostoc flagelliforme CCNUN1]
MAVELRSASDSLKTVQQKMQEYIDNGVRLGWLIDPQNQQVEIYRPGQDVEILRRRSPSETSPTSLSGEEYCLGLFLI